MKKILTIILLAVGCISASAQEGSTKEVFNPHWYVRGQVGMQHTLGEVKFSSLNSLNTQVALGYQFDKVWGARLTAGGWQSRGGISIFGQEYKYKWNYIAPTFDVTFDVTNAIWGYNPNRLVDFNIFAGAGVNVAWKNGEAACVQDAMLSKYGVTSSQVNFMEYLWNGPKTRAVGQFGATVDFNISKRVALGIEANANFISDKYNSKKAGNCDWYFNALAGVKIALGKTTKTVAAPVEAVPVVPQEKVVKVKEIVHDTVYIDKTLAADKLRRDIFFTIRNSEVSKSEMPKVEDIAAYLNKYPKAKVTITGYADKGTGNAKLNKGYAEKRAEIVSKLLQEKFGIKADRIKVDSKGDTEQPYDINDLNRVSICVAE